MSSGVLTAFFAQVVIVTYRSYAGSGVAGGGIVTPAQAPVPLPLPSTYTSPVIVYGALALFPGQAQRVAGMIGWGLVAATLLNLWSPGGKVAAPPNELAADVTPTGTPLPATRISST